MRRSATGGMVALCLVLSWLVACPRPTGELTPPAGTPPFPGTLAQAFDNRLSLARVSLEGRASHDVLDQRLFGQRLGHADVVAMSTVRHVWTRRRGDREPQQFLELEIGEVLLGELPRGTEPVQVFAVETHEPLPGRLSGERMLLFVHWAPGAAPPFRHHLMPAEEAVVAFVRAMIEHAKDAGVLTDRGVPANGVVIPPPE